MKKFFKEFKEFISKGNVIDLAVALVMGSAFTAIVTSLVNDVIMPFIAAIFGKVDVTELSFTLNNSVIPYGSFVQAVINFLLIAFILFLVIRAINKARNAAEAGKAKRVTPDEKKEIAALGTVNMKKRKEVYKAALELRERKRLEEEARKKAEEEARVTTEKLLTEIRDILKKDAKKSN